MDKEEILKFLTETDEGKAITEELKAPLLDKRNQLFEQMTALKSEIETIKQSEAAKLQELEAKQRKVTEEKLLKENDFEAYKKFHEQEVQKLSGLLNDFKSKYAQKEAERVITETAAKYSKAPKPLQLLLRERIRSELNEEGSVNINVYGDDGKQMYFNGEPASVEHLVESLKSNEDYSPFFAGTGVSGSGTTKSETLTTSSYKDMNSPGFNLSKAMGNKV